MTMPVPPPSTDLPSTPNHPTNILLPLHHALSLQLTWRCNAACRFCAIRCSPASVQTMKIELFDKILDEAAAARDRIQHIEITGGEVFTEMKLLQSVAERFHHKKFPWIPISNAFWAVSRERAREVLSRLPGMLQIVFSVDRHHQEFVPESNVVNAARAALDLGIRVFITCGYFAGQTPGPELFSPDLQELFKQTDKVDHHFFPAIALGRALESSMDEIPYSYSEGPCYILSRMEVTPEGHYDACCVAATAVPEGLAALRLGNGWRQTESQMRREFLNNPLCLALATIGPAELYRRLNPSSRQSPTDFRCLCHVCVALCTMPNILKRVEQLLDHDNLWPIVSRQMDRLYHIPLTELPPPAQLANALWRRAIRSSTRRIRNLGNRLKPSSR